MYQIISRELLCQLLNELATVSRLIQRLRHMLTEPVCRDKSSDKCDSVRLDVFRRAEVREEGEEAAAARYAAVVTMIVALMDCGCAPLI